MYLILIKFSIFLSHSFLSFYLPHTFLSVSLSSLFHRLIHCEAKNKNYRRSGNFLFLLLSFPSLIFPETQQRAAPSSPRLALPPSGSSPDASDTEAEAHPSKRKPNQLEEAIRRVVESVYQTQPSWIEEATRNAAQSVIEQVQLQQP